MAKIATVEPELSGYFTTDGMGRLIRRLKVRTNADTPQDAAQALNSERKARALPYLLCSSKRQDHGNEMIVPRPGTEEEGAR